MTDDYNSQLGPHLDRDQETTYRGPCLTIHRFVRFRHETQEMGLMVGCWPFPTTEAAINTMHKLTISEPGRLVEATIADGISVWSDGFGGQHVESRPPDHPELVPLPYWY